MRRVITISRKKWGKSATKTEKIIRDAIIKPETLTEIDQYLEKSRSVTPYDLANRFSIRMSVAKRLLREKEQDGSVVAYVRESGFVVYSRPSELEKREVGSAALVAAALEEIAATAPVEPVIDEDMEAALAAASSAGTIVKPSKLARKRREAGVKKERKEAVPEVVIEPLVTQHEPEPEATTEDKTPKKKPAGKKPAKKEEKKPAGKKPAKKEEKKPAAKKPAKKEEKKPAAKKPAKKEEKKPAAKKPAKKEEKKPAAKKPAEKKAKKPDVSDIPGIGPKTADSLKDGGFKTVAAISKADPAKMAKKVDGISEAKAKQYVEAAKQLLQ
ncbi:MAG: helix-hairpin-helix domain-containing protein [Candidatus Thorarchaeota archaeon]